MSPQFEIEAATEADLPGILAIYNDAILSSTAVFTNRPVTLDQRRVWLAGRRRDGKPVLVAHLDGTVAGFASYGDFRAGEGYLPTVEHSVYVRSGDRRRGIGRELLEALIETARDSGKHSMVAGIDADNGASLKLHQALGFQLVGRIPRVASKWDRWLDLILLQLLL